MKFTAALLAAATAVSAMPQPVDLGNGVTLVPRESKVAQRRAARGRQTTPRLTTDSNMAMAAAHAATNNSNVEYSSNWAGAVLIGSGYTTVAGTITVPTPSVPSGGSSRTEYAASAWVGIDGDTCQTAILQTGVDFYVQGSSKSYDAWYEWYPDYAYTFSGFSISAGDSITMKATVSSKTSGTVTITNNSKGTSVSHTFTGQSGSLCETNAEWIVEDFSSGGSLVPFADFDTVTFTGLTPSASGATIIDIEQNGQVLTDCSATSSSVTCSYV